MVLSKLAFLVLLMTGCFFEYTSTDAKGYLYGLKQTTTNQTTSLSLDEIDPGTAQVVRRGQFYLYERAGKGLGCLDDRRGIYFTVATNISQDVVLLGISLQTLKRVTELTLPFLAGNFSQYYCNFDPISSDIIVEGRDKESPHAHHLWKYSPTTGKIESLTTVYNIGLLDMLGGFSVLDFDQRVEWLQMAFNDSGRIGERFFGYDIDTGFLLNIINLGYLITGCYDPYNQVIYGVGSRRINKDPGYERTLVEFTSFTTSFKVKSVLPFGNYDHGTCALDIRSRLLYVVMTKLMSNMTHPGMKNKGTDEHNSFILKERQGQVPSLCGKFLDLLALPPKLSPMVLLTINIDTGKVMAQPQLCEEPLSIGFWNRE